MAFILLLVVLAITNVSIRARPCPSLAEISEQGFKYYKLPRSLSQLSRVMLRASVDPEHETIQVILPMSDGGEDNSNCTITYQKRLETIMTYPSYVDYDMALDKDYVPTTFFTIDFWERIIDNGNRIVEIIFNGQGVHSCKLNDSSKINYLALNQGVHNIVTMNVDFLIEN